MNPQKMQTPSPKGNGAETSPGLPGIALHVLVYAAADDGNVIFSALEDSYPGSLIASLNELDEAREYLNKSVFDLIVVVAESLSEQHLELLELVRAHETWMPTLIIVDRHGEDRLHECMPDLNPAWETIHLETISPSILKRRIHKAIENHQRQWELNHLQKAFQSSLIQYRNLFDEVPDLIFLCDRSGCLLDVNASATRLFGLEKEDMLMQPIFDVFGIDHKDFDQLVQRAMAKDGPIEDLEIEYSPQGRVPIYGLTHLIRWQSGPNRPYQFQGVVKDISFHRRLENQLRQSEDKYRTLYELARVCSSSLRLGEVAASSLQLIHDCCRASGTVLLMNQEYEEMNLVHSIALPEEICRQLISDPPVIGRELMGKLAITAGVHKLEADQIDELHPALAQWLAENPAHHLMISTLGRGNPTLPSSLLVLLLAEHEENDSPIDDDLLQGFSKTLEMGLTNCLHYANSQEAEGRYRDLWENAPAFFISLLRGGIIFEINQTAADALGFQRQELIGQPIQRLLDPKDKGVFEQHHSRLMDNGEGQDYEVRLRRRNGEMLIASLKSEPLHDRHGILIGEKAILHDITRDKDLEDRLRDYAENLEIMVSERTNELTETMNFLNGILEGTTEYAILALDETGRFLHFSRGAQLLFEYSPEAMVNLQDLSLLIDFEFAPWNELGQLLNEVDEKGVVVTETPMITAGGRHLTALLTINRLKQPATTNLTYVAIIRDVTEQKELEDLLKLYTENLQQVIEEKSRELDRKHIQLIQSSKLATLGEMATGIAHELNQPLSGIRTRAQLIVKALDRKIVKPESIYKNQHEIIELIDRISHIINHMRIFARQDQQKFAPFKLTQSIDGALSLLGEQLRIHAIQVEKDYPAQVPVIRGEPLQIEQVLLNLLSNARDAMDERQQREREDTNVPSDYKKKLVIRIKPSEGNEACLEIVDNGLGIDREVQEKIFEPFFTTKPVGRGTGLGLSISYGILTNHNGRFEMESAPGEGTTFRVYLPLWKQSDEDRSDAHEGILL